MKTSRRILSFVLALALVMALSVTAFAKTSSEEIAAPGDDFVVFSIEIGTKTVNFTWKEINGGGAYKTVTNDYAAKVNNEITTEQWTGVKLADLLATAEKKTGVKLDSDAKISAVAADGYVVSFTVGEAKDDGENYLVAADAVKNYDGDTVYADSYVRIVRGDKDTMPNQANIRCVTGIKVTAADGSEIKTAGKTAGGDVQNSVFYIAVKDGSSFKFYYYTEAELRAYDNIYAFSYTDHSVDKVVYGRGAALSSLLADISDVTVSGDMIVQYAESDGYHADAATAIEDSAYKDKVAWLGDSHITSGGETAAAVETVICCDSWTVYDEPDENNVNSVKWEDADADSGYLRAYRQRDDANSAVIKTLMGVVVSPSGQEFSGKDGYTLKAQSIQGNTMRIIEPSTGIAYTQQKVTGLVPGMKYAVTAPGIANAVVSGAEKQTITAASGSDTTVTFNYKENDYLAVNGITYTLSSFEALDKLTQTPSAEAVAAHGTPYGYYNAMYYRYNGIWLSDLVSGDVAVVAADGSTLKIAAADLGKYFVACGNTASKSSTNVSEGKRYTYAYSAPQLLVPGDGTLVGENEAGKDGNKMVTVAMKTVSSITGEGKTAAVSFTDVKPTDWFYKTVTAAAEKGLVSGMGNGVYGAGGELTLAQAVTFAVRAYEFNNGGVKTVNSVEGNWYDSFFAAAESYGIIGKNHGDENKVITRGEAAVIFAAALGETKAVNDVKDGYFSDVKAGDACYDAVYALAKAGICNGMGDGSFGVGSTFKRSEVATIIARMCALSDPAVI